MRSPALDLRDLIISRARENSDGRYEKLKNLDLYHVGFDLSSVTVKDDIPNGILLLDIQGRRPDPVGMGMSFAPTERDQFSLVQIFFNAKQKFDAKAGQKFEDYPTSYEFGEAIKELIHGYNSWIPINGALYLSVLENVSTGYLDISQALTFPLLSTNYECQRKPFYINNITIELPENLYNTGYVFIGEDDDFEDDSKPTGGYSHGRILLEQDLVQLSHPNDAKRDGVRAFTHKLTENHKTPKYERKAGTELVLREHAYKIVTNSEGVLPHRTPDKPTTPGTSETLNSTDTDPVVGDMPTGGWGIFALGSAETPLPDEIQNEIRFISSREVGYESFSGSVRFEGAGEWSDPEVDLVIGETDSRGKWGGVDCEICLDDESRVPGYEVLFGRIPIATDIERNVFDFTSSAIRENGIYEYSANFIITIIKKEET